MVFDDFACGVRHDRKLFQIFLERAQSGKREPFGLSSWNMQISKLQHLLLQGVGGSRHVTETGNRTLATETIRAA